jgi:tripartite-type tricarboxylate transporter receptor subunit TctC
MISRRATLQGLTAATAVLAAHRTVAQDNTIRLLVGASAGTDFTARLIAEKLRDALGKAVIVVPRLGAGQRVALAELRHSPPDGRTLMLATSAPFSIYPHIYARLDYEPIKDFTPIAGVSSFDVGLATGPLTGARDVKELVAWLAANKDNALYGSSPGTGSLSHFSGIALSLAIKQPLTHVPYKDSGVAVIDLSSGRLPMLFTGLSGMLELHRAGKIRVIGSSGSTRAPLLPKVPTLLESGINVNSSATVGIFGPARMSPEVVAPLTRAILAICQTQEYRDKIGVYNVLPKPLPPTQLAAVLADEYKQFALLVKASGYVPE